MKKKDNIMGKKIIPRIDINVDKISINDGLAFILVVMIFVLGLLISDLQNKIGTINLFIAVVIVMLCCFGCFIFFLFISKKLSAHIISGSKIHFCSHCNEKDTKIEKLTTIVEQCKLVSDELYSEMPHYAFVNKTIIMRGVLTTQELANIELKLPSNTDVWIITETLIGESPRDLFFDVTEKNLEKKINYTYFIPNRATLDGNIKMIKDSHNNFETKIKFIVLSEDLFLLYSNLDLAIFNPLTPDKSHVYMQIPRSEDSGEVFYIHLDNKNYTNAIINRLESIIITGNNNL